MKIQELPQVPHFLPSIHSKPTPFNHINSLSGLSHQQFERQAQLQPGFSKFPYNQGICYSQPEQANDADYRATKATYPILPSQAQENQSNQVTLQSEESCQTQITELGEDECILVQCITDDGIYSREMWDHQGLSKIAM